MAVASPESTRKYTADELFGMPSTIRCELIRGELIELPPPAGALHGELTSILSTHASIFAENNNLGVYRTDI
jgi:hypothetical protein